MKLGEVLNGYRVVTAPTNEGGGKCVWAFAQKEGQDYFIKQFLDPKWPVKSAPGSERGKAARRRVCEAFEQRHRLVMERLQSNVPGGGNIVVARDFFLHGSTYYKVTERIDPANLDDLSTLSPRQQMVVMRTLALSVQQLHRIGIVHGDLKPANVLVQRKPGNELYTAKLIDFDDSYVGGAAPGRGEIGGDVAYGAPEWVRYVREDESVGEADLTAAADMFALGLILHEYLTGSRVGFDVDRFGTPGEAVRSGQALVPVPKLGSYVRDLVCALTVAEPADRPNITQFIDALDDEAVFDPASLSWNRRYYHNRGSDRIVTAPAAGPAAPGGRRWKSDLGSGGAKPEPDATRAAPIAEPKLETAPPTKPEAKPTIEPEAHPKPDRDGSPKSPSRLRIRMDTSKPAPVRGQPKEES